ncbi:hypothetical protein BGZ73_009029 [Actinomortierella ambigua]|nr:hypothetical protein BGZ73_009029 [Actinomortierella ambigua]
MGKIVPLSSNIEHQYENDNTPIMNRSQTANATSSGRPAERALRSAPIPTLPPSSPVRPGFQQGGGGGGGGGGGRQGGGGHNARRHNTTHHGHRNGGGGGGGGRYQQQQQQQQYPPSPSYNQTSPYSAYPASPSSPSFSSYPPTPSSPLPPYQELNMYVERPSPVAQPPQYSARNMVYHGGHGNGSSSNLSNYNNYYGNQQHQQQYHYHSNHHGGGRGDSRHQSPYRSNSGDVGGGGGSGYPKRTALPTGNTAGGAYYPMTRTGTQRQRSARDDDGRVGEGWMCCKEVASFCPCCCFCCIFAGMGIAG